MPPPPPPIQDRLPAIDSAPAVPLFAILPSEAPRGIVVLYEIFGRQPEIDRVVERFADAGYAAVAPDLFHGRGVMACAYTTVRSRKAPPSAHRAIRAGS